MPRRSRNVAWETPRERRCAPYTTPRDVATSRTSPVRFISSVAPLQRKPLISVSLPCSWSNTMQDSPATWVRREMTSRTDCDGFQTLICDEVYDASRTLCGSKRISSSASCQDFYNAIAGEQTNLEGDPNDCYSQYLRHTTSNLPTQCFGLILEPPFQSSKVLLVLSALSLTISATLLLVTVISAIRHRYSTLQRGATHHARVISVLQR